MRLFIAIDPPASLITPLRALQHRLSQADLFQGRFTLPENLHLTVLFLHEQEEEKVPAFIRAMQGLPRPYPCPIQIQTRPEVDNPRNPQVIWLPLISEEVERLMVLARAQFASQILDLRPLRPHITIARIRKLPDACKLLQALDAFPSLCLSFTATEIKLKASRSTHHGPRYTDLYVQSLGV